MNNISLSFELICLMSWLMKNEKKSINALVKLAIEHGFTENLEVGNEDDPHQMAEHLYSTVTDFLLYLEESLLQQLNENSDLSQQDLLPMIKKLDGELDRATLWQSMQQTRKELSNLNLNSTQPDTASRRDAELLFLKKMLKNWSLSEEEIIN